MKPSNCQDSRGIAGFALGVGLLLSVTIGGCSAEKGPQHTGDHPDQDRTTLQAPTPEDSEPIVRLDPPTLEEPKADAPKGVLLRLNLKPGQSFVRVFRGESRISLEGAEPVVQKFSMSVTSSVESQDGDIYTLKLVATPLTVEKGEATERSGFFTEKPTVVDVDSRGRLLTPPEAVVAAVQLIGFIPFPEKRIVPGTSWSMTGEREWPLLGKVKATETWTFQGEETFRGVRAYKVEQTTKSDVKGLKARAVFYFEATTGRLIGGNVRQEGTVSLPAPNGEARQAEVSLVVEITSDPGGGQSQ